MIKESKETPICPKCVNPMKWVSTGSLVMRFDCEACKEITIVRRDNDKRN